MPEAFGRRCVQPELSIKGQQWYRGVRELFVQENFSGLREFVECYRPEIGGGIEAYINLAPTEREAIKHFFSYFSNNYRKARALLLSLESELQSRELEITTQLSSAISADEFDKAQSILENNPAEEVMLRAGGVIARVALERHLHTVTESHQLAILPNPASKKKPDVADVLNTLVKASIIKPIPRAELDFLFKVANNCAHPKEPVTFEDVQKLIQDGRSIASVIV